MTERARIAPAAVRFEEWLNRQTAFVATPHDAIEQLQADIAAGQLAEKQWLEAGRITAVQRDEDTQCKSCGEYDGKHVADCHGEPCPTCGCVGGCDEDLHAEARLDSDENREMDRAGVGE